MADREKKPTYAKIVIMKKLKPIPPPDLPAQAVAVEAEVQVEEVLAVAVRGVAVRGVVGRILILPFNNNSLVRSRKTK